MTIFVMFLLPSGVKRGQYYLSSQTEFINVVGAIQSSNLSLTISMVPTKRIALRDSN